MFGEICNYEYSWDQFRSHPLPTISTVARFRVSQSDAVGSPVTVWKHGGDLVCDGLVVADGVATI